MHVAKKYANFSSNMKHHIAKSVFSILVMASSLLLSNCKSEDTLVESTKEKLLIIGNTEEPEGLDPQVVTGVTESNIIRSLFEGLCVENPDNPTTSKPGAAASWESDSDYKEWTFHIQPEARWSDGVDLTADDFEFSYHRILHPKFGAKYASMLYFIRGAEDYNKNHRELYLIQPESSGIDWDSVMAVNFRGDSSIDINELNQTLYLDMSDDQRTSYHDHSGLNNLSKDKLQSISENKALFTWPPNIDQALQDKMLQIYIQNADKDMWDIANVGVKVADAKLLKISLKAPTPFLPDITKHYTWYPVPKHVIEKFGDPMEQNYLWTEEGSMVSNGPFQLKEWSMNYRIEVESNPHYWDAANVRLKGIRFLPISNPYTEARMFFNNQLHATDRLASELIDYGKQNFSKNLKQETYLGTNFLRLNNNLEIFNDLNLRKALAYSIDSASIIEHILKGGQTVATGVVPPMGDYKTANALEFDVAQAQEFFSKTKYADDPSKLEITLLTTDKESAKVLAEALQDMWKTHLGVKIKIEQRDWKTYLDSLSKFNYGIATGGWIGDYPDPTTFLDIWKKGDGNNRTGWSSEAYEAKLKEAETAATPDLRLKLLSEAENIFLDDLAIIPLYWYTSIYLLHESVGGWKPSIMKNQPYKFMYLSE